MQGQDSGLVEVTRRLCGCNFFVVAAIILWDYPCQVHLKLEFHICAGSCFQYEASAVAEKLLHFAKTDVLLLNVSHPAFIYQDVAKQVGFVFFCAVIYFLKGSRRELSDLPET